MSLTRFEKVILGISGITALGIGVAILAAPDTFYASYGITLGNDTSLLSELRAPGPALPQWASSCWQGLCGALSARLPS